MRIFFFLLLCCSLQHLNAQKTVLMPGSPLIQQKWIANEVSDMNWYMMQGPSRLLLGTVTNEVQRSNNLLYVITKVKMKQFSSPWIDSTVAELGTFAPIYHSSFNSQRTMYLSFGRTLTGHYRDFIDKSENVIRDTLKSSCFDSNLYPSLIRWLPLRDGYTQEIAIYDYNPKSKSGIMKATVTGVKKGLLESARAGKRSVWVVTVTDQISEGTTSTYYIDQLNRKLWKQEIEMPGRKMLMEVE